MWLNMKHSPKAYQGGNAYNLILRVSKIWRDDNTSIVYHESHLWHLMISNEKVYIIKLK